MGPDFFRVMVDDVAYDVELQRVASLGLEPQRVAEGRVVSVVVTPASRRPRETRDDYAAQIATATVQTILQTPVPTERLAVWLRAVPLRDIRTYPCLIEGALVEANRVLIRLPSTGTTWLGATHLEHGGGVRADALVIADARRERRVLLASLERGAFDLATIPTLHPQGLR